MSAPLVVALLVRVDLRTGLIEVLPVPQCEPAGTVQAQQMLEAALALVEARNAGPGPVLH